MSGESEREHIGYGKHGLNYNFGINISTRVLHQLGELVIGAVALTGSLAALLETTTALEKTLNGNIAAFGGYQNSLAALNYANELIMKGLTDFPANDLLEGFKDLGKAGLDVHKNWMMVNKAAKATGVSFSEMSKIIQHGDINALYELGIVTEKTKRKFENLHLSQKQMMAVTLDYLKQAERIGKFDNTIDTLEGMFKRLSTFKEEFTKSIVGDPKDPQGFANTFKRMFKDVLDWLFVHWRQITYVGAQIGLFLKNVMLIVGDFMKRIWHNVESIKDANEAFFSNLKDRFMSFGLWLGVTRELISRFFDKYGHDIKNFLKVLGTLFVIEKLAAWTWDFAYAMAALKVAMEGTGSGVATKGLSLLLNPVAGVVSIWRNIGAAIESIGGALLLLAENAMIAMGQFIKFIVVNPALLVTLVAVGAAIYIVYKNWDRISSWAKNHSTTLRLLKEFVIGLAAAFILVRGAMFLWQTGLIVFDLAMASSAAATFTFAGAFEALSAAMLANPIVLVIAALAALGVAIYEVYQHWDQLSDSWAHFNWNTLSIDKAHDQFSSMDFKFERLGLKVKKLGYDLLWLFSIISRDIGGTAFYNAMSESIKSQLNVLNAGEAMAKLPARSKAIQESKAKVSTDPTLDPNYAPPVSKADMAKLPNQFRIPGMGSGSTHIEDKSNNTYVSDGAINIFLYGSDATPEQIAKHVKESLKDDDKNHASRGGVTPGKHPNKDPNIKYF